MPKVQARFWKLGAAASNAQGRRAEALEAARKSLAYWRQVPDSQEVQATVKSFIREIQ
ncbi:hypothetical protein GW781_00675 [bacterium]|nr:hypothetical protein [bacterium]NCT19647.1 hypothetical protein [bacterium]